jgi:trimethylamine--corrinoid protein Co-methyltransferase
MDIYDQEGELAMQLGTKRCYYGPGSDCMNIIDHRDGKRRKPVLQDVVDGAVLCDALENIDFLMSMVVPSDVDPRLSDRRQMEAMLGYSTKPILYVTNEFSGTLDAVEMAEAAAGGPEPFRERPFAICYINVTTGLLHNDDALQKLLFLARKGLPLMYIPVCQAGTTAPVTEAAGAAMVNAGALVGLVLSQLVREGTPFVVPGWSSEYLDMRTLVSPYTFPHRSAIAQSLANGYGLPMFGIGGCSDSKAVDQQAAVEAALSIMTETLGCADLVHDLGYLESGLTFSLAQLAICDEIVGWMRGYIAPVDLSDEALALDLIDERGPTGQYMNTKHTQRNWRKRWYPQLFDRATFGDWSRAGSTTLAERAAQRVAKILAEHEPRPLAADAVEGIQAVIARAEAAVN